MCKVLVLLVAELEAVVERDPAAEAASARLCEIWLRKGLRRTVEVEGMPLGAGV